MFGIRFTRTLRRVGIGARGPAAPRIRADDLRAIVFSREVILQGHAVQRQIGHQELQLAVLVFEILQPPRLTGVHAAQLGPLPVERLLADTGLPAEVSQGDATLGLLQDPNALLFGKLRLPHDSLRLASSRSYLGIDGPVSGVIGCCLARLIGDKGGMTNPYEAPTASPTLAPVTLKPALAAAERPGWANLLIFGMCVGGPFRSFSSTSTEFRTAEVQNPVLIGNPDWTNYKVAAWVLVGFCMALIFSGGLALLKSRRSKVVPYAITALWISGPLSTFLMILIGKACFTGASMSELAEGSAGAFGLSALYAGVWTAYLLRSQKVREYYTAK